MSSDRFFEIVDDPAIFCFKGHNLLTVLRWRWLDRNTKSQGRWKVQTRRDALSMVLVKTLRFIKSLFVVLSRGIRGKMTNRSQALFFGVEGRHSTVDGATFDLYNARIAMEKGRDKFFILESYDNGVDKRFRADLYLLDLYSVLKRLLRPIYRRTLSDDLHQYAQSIVDHYPDLGFDEEEIAGEALRFYIEFLIFRALLFFLAPERALLICYYGRESFIAACKSKGIEVIELQHGAISSAHPMYCFPESYRALFSQAPFPDKIAVYGKYWKEILVKDSIFPAESILVIGYYLMVADETGKRDKVSLTFPQGKTILLISSQPTVQDELCEYIAFLKSQLSRKQWYLIIKPHPREDAEIYSNLLEPDFISLSHQSIYGLLACADVHIGVYSTVIYEAVQYTRCNYVLYVDSFASYCDEIVDSGIALPIKGDQIPMPDRTIAVDSNFYFADYAPSVLFADDC
jgi:hypothetical protein